MYWTRSNNDIPLRTVPQYKAQNEAKKNMKMTHTPTTIYKPM